RTEVRIVSAINITLPSVQSLYLKMRYNGHDLGSGTGFVAHAKSGQPVLLTNWHNVSGRHPETKAILSQTQLVPNELCICHNRANRLGEWVERTEKLHSLNGPLWREHPALSDRVDFVALPLTQLQDVQLRPHTLGVGDVEIQCGPADVVSVI